MEEWRGWRKISYESELDHLFVNEIASIPGGDKLFACIQCGTCSGMCPLTPYMDYTPRQIIAMIRAGLKWEVLSCYTTWLCASCYSCTVECPKEIKLTDIMYAVKRMAIKQGVYPKKFFKSVEDAGRSSEGRLILRLFLKTNPLKLLKQTGLGLRLLLKGRFSLKKETIHRRKELKSVIKTLETEHMVKSREELGLVKETSI